jgi:hypothetical protein
MVTNAVERSDAVFAVVPDLHEIFDKNVHANQPIPTVEH